jgi:hypothetical protein
MRPHVLELPLIWVAINIVALFVAGVLAEGLLAPDASRGVRTAIWTICLVAAGSVLYAIRRRFIPR